MRNEKQLKTLSTGELLRERDDMIEKMKTFGSVSEDRTIVENMNKVLASRGISEDMDHDAYTQKYGVFGRAGALGRGLVNIFDRISGSAQPTNHASHNND